MHNVRFLPLKTTNTLTIGRLSSWSVVDLVLQARSPALSQPPLPAPRLSMRLPTLGFFTRFDGQNWFPKGTPWVQIIQGVKGQKLSLDEVYSKIDTLLQMNKK